MQHVFVDTKQPTGGYTYQCVLCKLVDAKYPKTNSDFSGCPTHDSHEFHSTKWEYPDANTPHKCKRCGCDSNSEQARQPCPIPETPRCTSGGRAHWLDYAMELGM